MFVEGVTLEDGGGGKGWKRQDEIWFGPDIELRGARVSWPWEQRHPTGMENTWES